MRVRKSGTYYYYDCGGKPRREIPLGSDFVIAVQKWAELELLNKKDLANGQITFKFSAERYIKEILPGKAPRTQSDNIKEFKYLLEFFGDAPLDEIKPLHIRQYMDWRHQMVLDRVIEDNKERKAQGRDLIKITGKEGHVRANREISLFSHVFNVAREWGYTDVTNPALGVRRNKETGRQDVYIHDDMYRAVYDHAGEVLRDYMDFMYLSGQRNADSLKADERHIIDGAYEFRQQKTGKPLRISLTGEFGSLIERMLQRKAALNSTTTRLIVDENGQAATRQQIRKRFDAAREAAGIKKTEFQLMDLRGKAATDKEEKTDLATASAQLGHDDTKTTNRYVRHRRGKLVEPTK